MQFNPLLDAIKNYVPEPTIDEIAGIYGLESKDIIALASNENPYGCSPRIKQTLGQMGGLISTYPDDQATALKQLLAKHFKMGLENLIIGSGSDEIIWFCLRAKCTQGSKILTAGVTFGMYGIYATKIGAQVIKTQSQTHNLDEMLELYKKHQPEVIFLCLPNNPLGECLDFAQVEDFIQKIDPQTLIVLDGAYQEFAKARDAKKAVDVDVIKRFNHVIYLGTFSKAYGLAGMRIGYGIANEHLIRVLNKIRPPYNVGILSLKCAAIALEDREFLQKCTGDILNSLLEYERFFTEAGVRFIVPYGNFITFFCSEKMTSTNLCLELRKRGVLVKDLSPQGLNAIRLSMGTITQNLQVFGILREKLY